MVKRAICLAAAVLVSGIIIARVSAQRGTPIGEWRHYGGDAASTKYSPLDQINRAQRRPAPGRLALELAGQRDRQGQRLVRPGAYQDTPLMVNGVLYTTTSLGIFVAHRSGDRQTLWQYDPEIWKGGRPPNLGFTHRGMAYWTDGTRRAASSAARTTPTSFRSTPRPASPIRRSASTAASTSSQTSRSPTRTRRTTPSTRRRSSSRTSSSPARTFLTDAANEGSSRAATSSASTCGPARSCGPSTRFRSRASSATTPGKTARPSTRATPTSGR